MDVWNVVFLTIFIKKQNKKKTINTSKRRLKIHYTWNEKDGVI